MSRRLDWRKAALHGRPTLSVSQEREWQAQDRAAKWLAKAERRQWERRNVTPSRTTPKSSGWITVSSSAEVRGERGRL